MPAPGPTEEPALAWLDSGLYKLLFNVSVKQAVVDAEMKLSKAKSCGLMEDGPSETQVTLRRLDSAVKCVTAVACELSHSALLWQLLMQLLLLSTIKKILQCNQELEDVTFDLLPSSSAPLLTPGPEPPRTPQPGLTSAEQAALAAAAAAAAAAEDESFSSMQFAVPVRMVPWHELAIQKPLGQGAYGTVFAASLKGTQVAVKCLELIPEGSNPKEQQQAEQLKHQCNGSRLQEQQEQQQLLQLLKREASMMLASQHPNIVRCLGVSLDETPAIVMELCNSGSLHHALHRPQFTPLRVLKLLHEVACAMSFLHAAQDAGQVLAAAAAPPSPRSASSSQLLQAGLSTAAAGAGAAVGPGSRRNSSQRLGSGLLASVLHCDLRAPNLLLSGLRPDSWSIKVADFGLAQWTGEDGETALTDTVTNRLWLAPEVLHSQEQTGNGCFVVSKAADVYSFGCIMYEVLTGRLPFETDSVHQQMLEVIGGFGDPVGRLGPLHWPSEHELQQGFNTEELLQLKPLFEACVDTDPAARPNFEQVQAQLQKLVQAAARAVQAKAAVARTNAAAAAAAGGAAASGRPASTVALPAPRTPGGQQQQHHVVLQESHLQEAQQQQQQPDQQPQPGGLVFMPSLCEMAEGESPANAPIPAAAAAAAAQATAFDAPAELGSRPGAVLGSKPAAGPTTPVPSAVAVGGFGTPGRALDSSSSPFAWMSGPQVQPPLGSNFMSPFMASNQARYAAQAGDSS